MEKESSGVFSIISKFTQDKDQVWKHLVCPPKHSYSLESLGPPTQSWENVTYTRNDGTFKNKRGHELAYTYFCPDAVDHSTSYTIIYLHSHGGCRVEGYHLLRVCGSHQISLCLFDYSGAGLSDGDYLSMGIHEKEDTVTLLDFLRTEYSTQHFVVWGRSMGASTALQGFPMFKGVFALVLDSPFATVNSVYRNAAKQFMSMPGIIIDLVFNYATSEIIDRYGFDVSAIRPYDNGRLINVPTVLIGTKEDKITDFEDLLDLYHVLRLPSSQKIILECPGKHNDDRNIQTITQAVDFVTKIFRQNQDKVSNHRPLMDSLIRVGEPEEMGLRLDNRNDNRWAKSKEMPRGRSIGTEVAPPSRTYIGGGLVPNPLQGGLQFDNTQLSFINSIDGEDNDKGRRRAQNTKSLAPNRPVTFNLEMSGIRNPKNFSFKYGGESRDQSVAKVEGKAPGPHIGAIRKEQRSFHQYSVGTLPTDEKVANSNNTVDPLNGRYGYDMGLEGDAKIHNPLNSAYGAEAHPIQNYSGNMPQVMMSQLDQSLVQQMPIHSYQSEVLPVPPPQYNYNKEQSVKLQFFPQDIIQGRVNTYQHPATNEPITWQQQHSYNTRQGTDSYSMIPPKMFQQGQYASRPLPSSNISRGVNMGITVQESSLQNQDQSGRQGNYRPLLSTTAANNYLKKEQSSTLLGSRSFKQYNLEGYPGAEDSPSRRRQGNNNMGNISSSRFERSDLPLSHIQAMSLGQDPDQSQLKGYAYQFQKSQTGPIIGQRVQNQQQQVQSSRMASTVQYAPISLTRSIDILNSSQILQSDGGSQPSYNHKQQTSII